LSGDRGIVVGGDAIRSIFITGDQNRVFVGDYELLRDAYIEAWSVFERTDVEHFVGREWLVAELDAFMSDQDRGYFILEAPAGVGKTAFLAHLVAERGYVHHFVELARGQDGVAAGLKNLAAQVVRACELVPYIAEEVLPAAAGSRPAFFSQLLKRASERLVRENRTLVIVVDALDEAGAPVGHNALGLPETLPEGIFFVVSQRPVPIRLDTHAPIRVSSLEAEHEQNIADMRRYIERAVAAEPLASIVSSSDHDASVVVDALLKRSSGVWIYLRYVLDDIRRHSHEPLSLDVLPDGIWDYYARFWRGWRAEHRDEWYGRDLPLLVTLAIVQEPATAALLRALAGAGDDPSFEALLDEQWRPFLAVSEESSEPRYRVYHASLREFVEGRVESDGRRAMDVALARELADAIDGAHRRIADRYLIRWGTLDEGLPGLRHDLALRLDGGYGFRFLAAHLVAAGRDDELDRLLRLESVDGRADHNVWFAAHEATGDLAEYLADVARAWRRAEVRSDDELPGGLAPTIALEVRYALLFASLNALAGAIPPPVLVALVDTRVWSPEKGLAYARQVPDEHARAAALVGLAPSVPRELQHELLGAVEALESERERAIAGIVEHLPQELLARVQVSLAAASEHERAEPTALLASRLARDGELDGAFSLLASCPAAWAAALTTIAPNLRADRVGEALELAAALPYASDRVRALLLLRSNASRSETARLQNLVLEALPELTPPDAVAALAALAPELEETTARAAVDRARDLTTPWSRACGLATVAGSLAEPERGEVAREALAEARSIELASTRAPGAFWEFEDGPERELFLRADALGSLLPVLSAPEAERVADEATEEARSAFEHSVRSVERGVWSTVTSSSSGPMLRQHGAWLGAAPLLLAERLEPANGEKLVETTLDTVRAISDVRDRASVLLELLPHIPQRCRRAVLADAERAADDIGDPEQHARLLLRLLPEADDPSIPRLARTAIALVRDVPDALTRFYMLGDLAGFAEPHAFGKAVHEELARSPRLPPNTASQLDTIAPYLDRDVLLDLLAVSRVIGDAVERDHAMANLVPYSETHAIEAAIAGAGESVETQNDRTRIATLSQLAQRFAAVGRADDAIRTAEELPDPLNVWPSERAEVLKLVALELGASDPGGALNAAARISRDDDREEALASLLTRVPESWLPEVESLIDGLADPGPRSLALFALARRFDESGRTAEAIEAAQNALGPAVASLRGSSLSLPEGTWVGKLILAWLFERLPSADGVALRERIRAEVEDLAGGFQATALDSLDALENAPDQSLPAPSTQAGSLDAAERATAAERARLIVSVADTLDAGEARRALRLVADDADDESTETGSAVRAVAERLVVLGFPAEATAALLTLSDVNYNWDDSARTEALTEHTANLAHLGYLDEARAAARLVPELSTWGNALRAPALADLAVRYAAIDVNIGLECALEIHDDDDRARALAAFADAISHMPAQTLLPVLRVALARAAAMARRSVVGELASFAPVIATIGGMDAVGSVRVALDDVGRWWA
jgi:hypothetical protein